MALQVTSFLRSIWQSLSWRNDVLAAFEQWVQDGASRNDVKSNLQAMLERDIAEKATVSIDEADLKHINWDQCIEFLCTCFYRKRLRSPLPDIPPDYVWMTLTEQQNWGPLSLHPQQDKAIKETVPVPFFPLEQKLLVLGGTRMVYRYEPDLKLLLERGEPLFGPIELVSGDPHQCHMNVTRIWNEQRELFSIVTGYALSEDSLWRQHSWLLQGKSTLDSYHLIETTTSRLIYFGVVLTQAEAETFYQRNIDR